MTIGTHKNQQIHLISGDNADERFLQVTWQKIIKVMKKNETRLT